MHLFVQDDTTLATTVAQLYAAAYTADRDRRKAIHVGDDPAPTPRGVVKNALTAVGLGAS